MNTAIIYHFISLNFEGCSFFIAVFVVKMNSYVIPEKEKVGDGVERYPSKRTHQKVAVTAMDNT